MLRHSCLPAGERCGLALTWPLPEEPDDQRLAQLFYPGTDIRISTRFQQPEWPEVHQAHRAGGKCFVDYCEPTIPIVSASTGEIRQDQVLVAVLHTISAELSDS